MKTILIRLSLAFSTFTLAACGGGGGGGGSNDSSPPSDTTPAAEPTAEGRWSGTESGGFDFDLIIKNDGELWLIYGDDTGVFGFMQGSSSTDGNEFTSTNIRDYSFLDSVMYRADVQAQFLTQESFDGLVTYDNLAMTTNFTSTYVDAYELEPSLSSIAGTYDGEVAGTAGFEVAVTEISESGELSGLTSGGCAFDGSVSPNPNGNVYDVEVTFQGGPCLAGTETVGGAAYEEAGFLYAAVVTGSRDDGFLLLGQRR